jgi:hypothetical protein
VVFFETILSSGFGSCVVSCAAKGAEKAIKRTNTNRLRDIVEKINLNFMVITFDL